MGEKVPTLTTAGWVDDLATKAITLIEYFIISQKSQTRFYKGYISSLPALVQAHGHSPQELAENTREKLHALLSRYFEEALVDVRATHTDAVTGRYNIEIDATVIDNGKSHSLGRLIEVGDSKIINAHDPGHLPQEVSR